MVAIVGGLLVARFVSIASEQEGDANKTRLAIQKDWNKTLIELERERRETAREILDHLPEGAEYRENTVVGEREIRKAQVSPVTLFVLPDADGAPQQTVSEQTELPARQPRALDQDGAAEPPHDSSQP